MSKPDYKETVAEIRNAKTVVDVYERSTSPLEFVTLHVHDQDDKDCIAICKVPVGAVNEFLQTAVEGVEMAESIIAAITGVAKARAGSVKES